MPQSCQIIGVNSVTNIELDKGVMPAPIIRNADWFGKLSGSVSLTASSALQPKSKYLRACHAAVPYLLQDSGKWPIY